MQQAVMTTLEGLLSRASSVVNLTSLQTTITTTNTNFKSFLVLLPWSTKFSNSPEVQVVLASVPLLILGFVGVGFGTFELSMGRMSRPFLSLFLGTFAALLAGIFELTNMLVVEFQGESFLRRGLLISEGLAMTSFIGFKFSFLYYQSQRASLSESLSNRSSLISGRGSKVLVNRSTNTTLHSGSYERFFGGGLIKLGIFLTVLVVTLLEGIWRFGFTSKFQNFLEIYTASGVLGIILLFIFAFKFLLNAYLVEPMASITDNGSRGNTVDRSGNFLEVFPYILGIVFGITNLVISLLPGVTLFSETPLGRFIFFIESYIYILTLVIEDHRRPSEDSISIEELISPSVLPQFSASTSTVRNKRPTSSLPERIIVRRGSQVPSWLTSTVKNDDHLDREPLSRSRSHSLAEPPASPIDFDLFYDTEDSCLRPPSALGLLNINYEGRNSLAFPESIHVSEANYRQSHSATIRSSHTEAEREGRGATSITRRNTHTRDISVARFDSKGNRINTPNYLDSQFSFTGIMQKQKELKEAEIELNKLNQYVASRSLPTTANNSPTNNFKNLQAPVPRLLPVPRGIGIDTSLYMPAQTPINRTRKISSPPVVARPTTNLSTLSSDSFISRKNSTVSEISLSTFPVPPSAPPPIAITEPLRLVRTSSLGQYQRDTFVNESVHWNNNRPETSLTNYSRNTENLVDGIEFEIFSPSKNNNKIDEIEVMENNGIKSPSNSFETDGLDSPMLPISPGIIQQYSTVQVPTTPSASSIISRAASTVRTDAGERVGTGTGAGIGVGASSRNLFSATTSAFSRRILNPSRPNLLPLNNSNNTSFNSTSSQGKSLPRTPSPPSPSSTIIEIKPEVKSSNNPIIKTWETRPRPTPLVLNKIEGMTRGSTRKGEKS